MSAAGCILLQSSERDGGDGQVYQRALDKERKL